MKTKVLLTVCAILIAIIAIGCSNGSRTTAPGNTTESLNMPNGTDINRFEDVNIASKEREPESGWSTLMGTYYRDPAGCISLQINKATYVELQFTYDPPRGLRNGMVVRVIGHYGTTPGHCGFSNLFIINEMTILGDRVHDLKINQYTPE